MSRVLEWNPILIRETRARFRHWGAFGLLFGYAALLALAIGWTYADSFNSAAEIKNPLFRLSAVGHELFLTLTWMQALAWVLIAPAITASSIAREREDGLLEGVLLSPLPPTKIFLGKLFSALSFVALLLVVSLPVQAVCFLMGGVSPEEFRAAILLHATTAFTGAVIGLACSAWSRRANIALRSAYVLVIAWLIGSAISFSATAIPWMGPRGTPAAPTPTAAEIFWSHFNEVFGWTNPIIAAISIATTDAAKAPTLFFSDTPWLISVTCQLLLCVLLVPLSTLALRRPFEARDETKKTRLQQSVALPATAVSTPGTTVRAKVSHHDWIELPGTSQLQFSNPVLQREARGKFRLKAPPLWALIGEVLLGLIVAYYYFLTLHAAFFKPNERETIWWVIAFIGLFVIAVSAAVMGASAFTRERESQTWNSLRLSLLRPAEIIDAKLSAILLAFLVYSLPMWPLLVPCVRLDFSLSGGSRTGVSLLQALLSIGIVTATAVSYSLWGMWWSWRCKRTVGAVGWTLGSLFFLLVFAPAFLAMTMFRYADSDNLFWSIHSFVALGFTTAGEVVWVPWGCIFSLLAIALFLRLHLRHSITTSDNSAE